MRCDPIPAALTAITRGSVSMDVASFERVRNPFTDPLALAYSAALIEREFAQLGFRTERQRVDHDLRVSANIIGERPGTRPASVVIVGAHYDTVPFAPGADDNGSGLAGLLAVARAAARVQTEATIRVIAFSEEEYELGGSQAYVRSLSAQERARIRGVIVMDMIGYASSAPNSQRYPSELTLLDPPHALPTRATFIAGISLIGEDEPHRSLLEAQRYTRALHVETLALPRFLMGLLPDMARSDHAPFWRAGIPAISLTDTADFRSPHYHRSTDRLATLDLAFAARSVRLAVATTLLLAKPIESCEVAIQRAPGS